MSQAVYAEAEKNPLPLQVETPQHEIGAQPDRGEAADERQVQVQKGQTGERSKDQRCYRPVPLPIGGRKRPPRCEEEGRIDQ